MKRIAILGSTGSIGINALDVIRQQPGYFGVAGLAAKSNAELLARQAEEFRPAAVCIYDETRAHDLQNQLRPLGIRVVSGDKGLREIASLPEADQVVCAMVGMAGLAPIFSALRAGKQLAIANKEPLVVAGELLMSEALKLGVAILPIDSEHSGLWQCLEGRNRGHVKKLILTSSGGPFRTRKGSLDNVTVEEALNHPKWKMGPKITVDSATLMNKALEVIEAANLFSVPAAQVEVLVHPEAIIHAMVEFSDGSFLAQMGVTDMRLPIQYALSYPERLNNPASPLDFKKVASLNFETPDLERFPCLRLGYEASLAGGTLPAVLNAANESAVEAFLNKRIGFDKIPALVESVMLAHRKISKPKLEELLEADQWARRAAAAWMEGREKSLFTRPLKTAGSNA